jgi:hypothetical protein
VVESLDRVLKTSISKPADMHGGATTCS